MDQVDDILLHAYLSQCTRLLLAEGWWRPRRYSTLKPAGWTQLLKTCPPGQRDREGVSEGTHTVSSVFSHKMTYWDLGENVQEQRDNGEVEADPGPSEPLLQVLGHRDHLTQHTQYREYRHQWMVHLFTQWMCAAWATYPSCEVDRYKQPAQQQHDEQSLTQ